MSLTQVGIPQCKVNINNTDNGIQINKAKGFHAVRRGLAGDDMQALWQSLFHQVY